MDATREQVIAYRVAAQQLDRSAATVADLAVLDLGVQEAMGQPAAYAFDARLPGPAPADLVGPGHDLALVWSLRGAPHVHRRGDLDALTRALYPLSEADARQRINETGPSVARAGITAEAQFEAAVAAMRDAVTRPAVKGAVSTAVSAAVPAAMLRDCRPCGARHISDSAMRASALAAGIELEPVSPPVLRRRPRSTTVTAPDLDALRALARAYLTLLGPANDGHVAGYLEARRADVRPAWPDDLVEVAVGRTRTWLPAERVDAFAAAPAPDLVRLLGAFDPYLQARDRDVIVPDKAVQKALWPVLGRPGAVFVDGEVLGTWRPKASGRALTLTVEAFAPLPKRVWASIETEAQRIGVVRGAAETRLVRVS